MRKEIYIVLLAMLPCWVLAAERSVVKAALLAAEKMHTASYVHTHTCKKMNSDEPAFYVFNQADKEGFVVVSADNRTEDILMYSDSGQLDIDQANPNLRFWLRRLQEEISAANDEDAVDQSTVRKVSKVTAISPLLVNTKGEAIAWYQESPYWNDCPKDLWKTDETCLTGCVATATAQIMYAWRYPEKGTGSHSYTWKCCTNESCTKTTSKTLSKDFSSVSFDWDNMLANYRSGKKGTAVQKKAVSELMYCCGVACDMVYGGNTIGGSGAWTDDMGYGLITYFGYQLDKFVTTYSRSEYSKAKGSDIPNIPCEWKVSTATIEKYFNADLQAGRPILMGGEDKEGAHEFVCDGRDSLGLFHINWGWEGSSNCYCKLTALKPTGEEYDFSSNIDALIGLRPLSSVDVEEVRESPQLDAEKADRKATKLLINQGLYILHGNHCYTMQGQQMR